MQLDLFLPPPAPLAAPPIPDGVRFGTSSWTYPGWQGQIYHRSYHADRDAVPMLKEYAQCPLFGCVGADSTYYRPPSVKTLQAWRQVTPQGFLVHGKAWQGLTIRRFTEHAHGQVPGTLNPQFLDPALAVREVVGPWLEHLQDRAGVLMFEFQAFARADLPTSVQWADALVAFFGQLPREGRYGVELRNPELLGPDHFAALRSVGVAHVFNSWARMPPIGAQLDACQEQLTAPFVIARALLRPGRSYAEAVQRFEPYDRLQEPQPEVREDLARLVETGLDQLAEVNVLVNNRLEGNAPATIHSLREMVSYGGNKRRRWRG